MDNTTAIKQDIRKLMVENLMLQVSPEEIGDDQPLFGPGSVGLDSVDALQLVVALDKTNGQTLWTYTPGLLAMSTPVWQTGVTARQEIVRNAPSAPLRRKSRATRADYSSAAGRPVRSRSAT